MKTRIFLAALCLTATVLNAQESNQATFAETVRCNTEQENQKRVGKCAGGLRVSGSHVASIVIENPFPRSAAIDLEIVTGETRQNIPLSGLRDAIAVAVYKTRSYRPLYEDEGGGFSGKLAQLFNVGGDRVERGAPNDARVIMKDLSSPILITVRGDGEDGKRDHETFEIDVRFETWRINSGGIYAYSWANDEELVTRAVEEEGVARSKIVTRRNGDNIGPITGVAFNFHPANYPAIGFEFGTASSGSARSNSYFLGTTLRLLGIADRAMLTVGAGFSIVPVKIYPGIEPGSSYDLDDPRLTGRSHSANAPYVSLGIGISLGPSGSSQQ